MTITREDKDRAEQRLLLAWRSRPRPQLPPRWREQVMAEVAAMAARQPVAGWAEARRQAFAALSFRFAAAGALCAAAFAAFAQIYGPDLEAHAARLIMHYPGLSQFLGATLWS